MQETWDPSLVWEDPRCWVTKPVPQLLSLCFRDQGATSTESMGCNYWSPCAYSPCSPTREATAMRNPHSLQLEKSCPVMKTQHACVRAKSPQSCLTLCDPMDFSQVPLSMGFSGQECWSGLPCPPPGDLLNPGIEPMSPTSPAFQADSLPTEPPGKSEDPA